MTTSFSSSISKSSGTGTDHSTTTTVGPPTSSVATFIGNSTDSSEDSDLDASYDITVPAFTSIESCSYQTLPELVVTYDAVATFTCDGGNLDGTTIATILSQEGYPGPFTLTRNSVKTRILGQIDGIMGMVSSTFRVNPVNAYELKGCDEQKRKLDNEKRKRIEGQIGKFVENGRGVTQEELRYLFTKEFKGWGGWNSVE